MIPRTASLQASLSFTISQCCLVVQSCLTLGDPMDCNPPGSSCPWEFSSQKYRRGLPCPPPEDLPNTRIEPRSPALQAESLLYYFPEFAQNNVLSLWCHLTVSSSTTPFSSFPPSFPAAGAFPLSQLFASGGQNIGDSASTSVLPMNIHGLFPLGLTGLVSF